jgi:GDP-mannose 6-dehydrogenase
MHSAILPSNQAHLGLALRKILATGKRRIGFIGLSFKTGTDDLRESPLVTLAEQLIGKGMQLAIYDPEVHLAQLLGSNRRYIEQHLPHIGQLLCADLDQVIEASDVLVLGQGGEKVRSSLASRSRSEQLVLDLIGLSDPRDVRAKLEGLCW